MKLNLTRSEVCDLMLSTTSIVCGARAEMNDESTSEERKNILDGTIKKWQSLHDIIRAQLEENDAK